MELTLNLNNSPLKLLHKETFNTKKYVTNINYGMKRQQNITHYITQNLYSRSVILFITTAH